MSDDAALFDKIKHKIKPKAVSRCPDAPGDLAVLVVRADDGTPIADARVKASGPSPGEAPTGSDGWVVFADVKPGAYNAEIKLPEALSKYQLDQATQAGSVACADTKILQFKASPPPPVKPLIEAPAVVVVKKPHTTPARRPVRLRTDVSFDGTGLLTRSSGAVAFYTSAGGGTALKFDGTDNKFTGAGLTGAVTLYAEGVAPSAALDDVELKLALSGGSKTIQPDAIHKMTSVEVTLDICESRTAAGTDPKPLSAGDKINVGRTVHVQDAGHHHGRALVIVRQVQPAAYAGNLSLRPRDARVRLFAAADEVAAAGQVAIANPRVFVASTVPAAGLQFWAEGASVSAALRDSGVELGVDGIEPVADRVAITVARLRRLEARIPATPAKRARMGNSPGAAHVLRRGTTAAPDRTNYDVDFTANPPLVLFRDAVQAAAPMALSVQVQPAGVPVRWSVQRDTRPAPDGDDAGVIALSPNPLPTLTPDGGDPLKATLLADAVGSFHLRPFIDANGDAAFQGDDAGGARIDREPFIIMNLVFLNVALFRDDSIARSANMVAALTGAGGITVTSGAFAIAAPAGEAIHMNVLADVVGGGGDGRRGLNRAFAGWCNNESANEDIAGTFTDTTVAPAVNHRSFTVFASNLAASTGGNNTFIPGDPAPALVAPALLDSGRAPGPGTGGDTATLTSSRIRTRTNQALGQRWRVEAIDSPGDGDGPTHPGFPAATLSRFRFHLDFRAYACFWTSISGGSGATGVACCRVYSVLHEFRWRMRGEWTIAGGVLGVVTAPAVTISGRTTHNPMVAAAGTDAEVRFPTGLNLLGRDARA